MDLYIDDFSGGLNLRDSPNQLGTNESPRCWNWAQNERGGLLRRKGCANLVALPGTTQTVADIFYSEVLDLWLCVRENSGTKRLFARPGDLSGSWTNVGQIASGVSARAAFADWPGTTKYCLILTDVSDASNGGLYTYDGTTLTKRVQTDCTCLAVWQNKVWAAGSTLNPPRVLRSPVGDPTSLPDFNDLRELNGNLITALAVGGGALLAFKKRSHYRITDAATGAYSTIDSSVGCVNPRAVVATRSRVVFWGPDGVYSTEGIGRASNVGDKIQPVYTHDDTLPATVVAGVYRDRPQFAIQNSYFPLVTDGTPLLYDFWPERDSVVPVLMATTNQGQISSLAMKDGVLYAALQAEDDLFRMFTEQAGLDGASEYASTWKTPWLLPNSGQLSRLQQILVQGLIEEATGAALVVSVDKDWNSPTIPGNALDYDLTTQLLAANSSVEQQTALIQSLGHAAGYQLDLNNNSDTDVGEISLRALQIIDTPIGWPVVGYPAHQRPDLGRGGGRNTPPPGPPPAA